MLYATNSYGPSGVVRACAQFRFTCCAANNYMLAFKQLAQNQQQGSIMSFKRIPLILAGILVMALTACTPAYITDFTDRSVVYGWVSLKGAAGNKITGGSLRNYSQPANESIYPMGYAKLDDGYVVYHSGVAKGPVKINTISAMSCLVLCGNTVNVYEFGVQGKGVGSAKIGNRGVYYLGSHQLDTGGFKLFGPRNFEVRPVRGPSRRLMLEKILEEAPEEQVPYIRAALNRL